MPIRLGPVGLTPTFAVTNFGVDTNVFNDSVDPQRDFTFTATPKVQARLRSGRLMLGGILATGLVYYQKFDDQRSVDYSAQGRGDVDLGWFQPYAFAERLDTRDRLSVELDLRAPRVSTAVEGGGRIVLSSTTGLRFTARRTSVAFEDGEVFEGIFLSETLNSHTTVLEGGLDLSLTPLTTFSVMVSGQQDRFESRPDRDSDSFKVMPTIRLEPPAIIQGSLAIGYRRFDGRTDALPDYSGIVYQGSLSHVIAERTKVDVGLARDVQYSFEVLEPYYVTTGVRMGLTHQLRETVDLRGAASSDRLDYQAQPSAEPASSRSDRVRLLSVGAGFLVRPNVRVGFDLEFTRRRSERADRQYRTDQAARFGQLRVLIFGVDFITMVALFFLLSLIAPSAPQATRVSPEYIVGTQDRLAITVVDEPNLTRVVTVGSDGGFDYPFIGLVKATGQTVRAIQQDITMRLKEKYLRNPQVSIEVESYRSQVVYVWGQVKVPGSVSLMGNITLTEALARAGSPTADAGTYIEINRRRARRRRRKTGARADQHGGSAERPGAGDPAERWRHRVRAESGDVLRHRLRPQRRAVPARSQHDRLEGTVDGGRHHGEGLAQPRPHHPRRQRQAGRPQGREAGRSGTARRLRRSPASPLVAIHPDAIRACASSM